MNMRVLSIVGARPQFVKLAPICWSSKDRFKHEILHTGQHYDPILSDSFFKILDIPKPDFQLSTGSALHGEQTGKMLIGIENILLESRPDHVIVYGDTNTTLAGALTASKLHIPISHVESGLRSFNRRMPEEVNRVIVDHCSNVLFAPTENAMLNLNNEGLGDYSILSGDVMVETLSFMRSQLLRKTESEPFLFATIHRAENTDDPIRIMHIISELRKSPIPVHLHCHPRLKRVLLEIGQFEDSENLYFHPPLDYMATIDQILMSSGVITDSGGLQKEAYILEKPCLVVRTESEWVEALRSGSNFLDPDLLSVKTDWWSSKNVSPDRNVFGDGKSSHLIIEAIANHNSSRT
jgi:UDP-N-acetylglucosamine 2-epimerase (non-hydrolysing)